MDLHPDVLDELAQRGLTPEHFDMLLHFLRVRRNGSWTWHYADGTLTQCDVRLVFPNKQAALQQVGQVLRACTHHEPA